MSDRPSPPHPVLRDYYRTDRDREGFVTDLFDGAAPHYEKLGWLVSFGLDRRYRRESLRRAGLRRGMRLLDVAAGTGLVTRSALDILRDPAAVVALDPSSGMLRQARRRRSGSLVQGRAEALPFSDEHFDVLSMGYALRHVPDLGVAFREYLRVLKPGGRVLVLEISRPSSPVVRWLVRAYLRRVVPFVTRLTTRSPQAEVLMRYYWDTIDGCVPPA